MAAFVPRAGTAAAEPREVFLWPGNEQAWRCWQECQDQRRLGMGGYASFDWGAIRAYLLEVIPEEDERREIFECITAAARATLEVEYENAEKTA